MNVDVDILIIGAGPVGLFTVFEAGQSGTDCLVPDIFPRHIGKYSSLVSRVAATLFGCEPGESAAMVVGNGIAAFGLRSDDRMETEWGMARRHHNT